MEIQIWEATYSTKDRYLMTARRVQIPHTRTGERERDDEYTQTLKGIPTMAMDRRRGERRTTCLILKKKKKKTIIVCSHVIIASDSKPFSNIPTRRRRKDYDSFHKW